MTKPESCRNCSLYSAPGPVWGEGSIHSSRLVYVGQNPGAEEIKEGRPFVGPSGRVLNRQLYEAGVHRDEMYITNQVKCLTPDNRPPTEQEVACCKPLLEREYVAARSAKCVVLGGATAFKANIGSYSTLHPCYRPTDNVMERMGCVEWRDGKAWVGTIHPAFIMRMPMFRHEPIEHLRKSWVLAQCGVQPNIVVETPSESQFRDYTQLALQSKEFADDVETIMLDDVEEDDYIGGDWLLTDVGFSAAPYHAYVIDKSMIHLWEPVFQDESVMQYEHNGEYDSFYLEKYSNAERYNYLHRLSPSFNCRFDTMLGHHYLHTNARKYLKPVTLRTYTSLPYYNRDLGRTDSRLYCGMDNITTLLAGREIKRQLIKLGMYERFMSTGMKILPIYEQWRRAGLRVDLQSAFLIQKYLTHEVKEVEECITKLLGPLFNWRSPKQLQDLFYKAWGLPVQYNKVKKDGVTKQSITTDWDARQALRRWIMKQGESNVPKYKAALMFFDLQDYASEKTKLLEYFGRLSPDGKLHAHWKAHGTATHRAASKPNCQNWPTWPVLKKEGKVLIPSMRSIVRADTEDDLLISCDFSQIQLWIYAVQFNIKWLLDVFKKGDYIYGAAYEALFKRPFFVEGKPRTKKNKLPSVTEEELLRAKAVPLGFLFARSGESVAAEKGWPASEGVALRKDWFSKVPELAAAHNAIEYEMRQKGQLRPPPGMLLHYPVPDLQGLNCFAQTPEAFIVMESIIEIEKALQHRDLGRTILQVHDSIVCNIRGAVTQPQRMVEAYETVIKPTLERPISWLKDFQFRHEAKLGSMWDWGMEDYDEWRRKLG